MNLLGYAGFASEDPMEDLKLFWKRGMAHLFPIYPTGSANKQKQKF